MRFPDSAGVMILDGCPLFPRSLVPLFIFEPRYRSLLESALSGDRMMCLAMRQPGSPDRPNPLAGLGLIRTSVKNPNGTSNLLLEGLTRVRLGRAVQTRPFRIHRIEAIPSAVPEGPDTEALVQRVLELVEIRLRRGTEFPLGTLLLLAGATRPSSPVRIEDCLAALRSMNDPGALADVVATLLISNFIMRQVVLHAVDVSERLRHVIEFLSSETSEAREESSS
ncbi:MAG: LON peptidase substrate-binding domain-containing protein [Verrucomicrobiota bacterium]